MNEEITVTANDVKTNVELEKVIAESHVEPSTALTITNAFGGFFSQIDNWKTKLDTVQVTDIEQKKEMKLAREIRLALADIRITADKKRKELKEDSNRYGKAVQGAYNIIEFIVKPLEKQAEENEKFAEIQESKRKAALKVQREMDLQPFAEFVPVGIDLAVISDDDFTKLFTGAKMQMQAKHEAEIKAENERIERERAEAEERERIKQENERLKIEAEKLRLEQAKKDAELKAERDRIEAERIEERRLAAIEQQRIENERRAEREAANKLAAELQAKKDAEIKAYNLEQDRLKQAKAAPDKDKFLNIIKAIKQAIPNDSGIKDDSIKTDYLAFRRELEQLLSKYENII